MRIVDAIRAAYTPEMPAQMMRERLYNMAGSEDFRAQVFHPVEWAERRGPAIGRADSTRTSDPARVNLRGRRPGGSR